MKVRFGTSGWRGVIARDFTWDRVDAVVDAIACHLLQEGRPSVVIGGDTRFLSPELAASSAERMAAFGFRVTLADRPVPTPVLSHAVRRLGLGGVINFTASHNPFIYNGIKFSPADGGPAQGSVTSALERLVESEAKPSRAPGGSVEVSDLTVPYRRDLEKFVSPSSFEGAGLRAVYDPFNGTASGLLDDILRKYGAAVRTIHERRDPLFDNRHPEPNEHGLADLSAEVVRSGAAVGLANDGDADRFGIVDEEGRYVSPHDFLPLLLEFLVEEKGITGAAVRSVSTGGLIDRVAAAHGLPLVETPVGFKYLGACMLERQVALAGEESGGLSVGGHVPEKDGILACLYAAEMICLRSMPLGGQLERMWSKYGRLLHSRLDIPLEEGVRDRLEAAFAPGALRSLGDSGIVSSDKVDGSRLLLEGGGWVLMRISGTEPLARIYLEAPSDPALGSLESAVRDLLS